MAERLTVTTFPKDMREIAEYLMKYANTKSAEEVRHTCGLLYLLEHYPKNREYPVSIDPVLGLAVEELQSIINSPNYVLLLIKYENDDDTEEDGEVPEP